MNSINTSPNINFKAKPIPKSVIERTKAELLQPKIKNIDIFCHTSADEDAINSAKVFANWLIANGKKVNICAPKSELKRLYYNPKEFILKNTTIPADKTVIVDFNSSERLSKTNKELLKKVNDSNVLIFDHHTLGDTPIKGKAYIDDTAKSCCSVLLRFFEGVGQKISKKDSKSLYCGMVSDFMKSKMLNLENKNGGYNLIRTPKLYKNKDSVEVLNKLETSLTKTEKNNIYKHLDVLSNLTPQEKVFQKNIYSKVKISDNGKMAYVVIPPNDKEWASLGMDTTATSTILNHLRGGISENSQNVKFLTSEQKEKMKNVDTVIAFYQKSEFSNEYRMSIHSKSNSALDLINYVKQNGKSKISAGGHTNRAGGKIDSIDEKDTNNFVSDFIEASKILE